MDTTLLMYAGVGAMSIGTFGVVASMAVGAKSAEGKMDAAARIAAYGRHAEKSSQESTTGFADAARQRAADVLANNRSLEARIARQLDGAASSLKPAEWVLVHGGITLVSALVFLVLSGGKAPFMLVGLVVGAITPWRFLGRRRKKRVKVFQEALPDTLQLMSGSLTAGLSLAQSIDTIVREAGEPISGEFRRVVIESRLGVPLTDALEGVGQRMQSKDFDWVVMAIRIQRDVGGNLAELLLTVAATLREREYIRRHVRALAAEGKLSCYVLGGLPPAFLGYLMLFRWNYVSPLFTTPLGGLILGGMAILMVVGFFWMSKVSKVAI